MYDAFGNASLWAVGIQNERNETAVAGDRLEDQTKSVLCRWSRPVWMSCCTFPYLNHQYALMQKFLCKLWVAEEKSFPPKRSKNGISAYQKWILYINLSHFLQPHPIIYTYVKFHGAIISCFSAIPYNRIWPSHHNLFPCQKSRLFLGLRVGHRKENQNHTEKII